MPTQAQIRQTRKERIRNMKRNLRSLDTTVERMQRRLDQILTVEREVSIKSLDSFFKMKRDFDFTLAVMERHIASVIGLFLLD